MNRNMYRHILLHHSGVNIVQKSLFRARSVKELFFIKFHDIYTEPDYPKCPINKSKSAQQTYINVRLVIFHFPNSTKSSILDLRKACDSVSI